MAKNGKFVVQLQQIRQICREYAVAIIAIQKHQIHFFHDVNNVQEHY